MQYGAQWNQIGSILRDHWHVLTHPSGMEDIVGSRPHMVAKRARNLDDTLVQSEFVRMQNRNWLTDMPRLKAMYPCGHCGMCCYVERPGVFTDSERKHEFEIQHFINSATTRVLYILKCPCKKLYVGKTKHQLRIRISEHLKSIRQKEETPMA